MPPEDGGIAHLNHRADDPIGSVWQRSDMEASDLVIGRRDRTFAIAPLDANVTHYLNRELSWLSFNARVLALAMDEEIPLLERVKYLAIYASNLDEFFQVRLAGLKDLCLLYTSDAADD